MNKDAILATIIGFGVGLVIAGVVFLGPTVFKGMPRLSLPDLSFLTKINTKTPPSDAPKTQDTKNAEGLVIESPLPDSIEPKEETLVSGTTMPNAIVVLEGKDSESVTVANTEGAYAGKLSLSEGKNDITVTSYGKTKTDVQTVTVYYTPEDF